MDTTSEGGVPSTDRVADEPHVEGASGSEGADSAVEVSPAEAERAARETVYRLLAVRARSRVELLRALSRAGVDSDTAHSVLDKFVDAGLVDDAAFAAEWVRSRHRQRGLGRRALEEELREKGVDDDAVSAALSTLDTEDEVSRARELVRRKLAGTTVTDPKVRMRRLVGMLARKGYGEALAFRVVREELEALDEEGHFDDAELVDPDP
ncbi:MULTISPECIES: regulatory protein RecX [unclassified Actinopolyspora]|uniref:regulatory protein RecX n=1 Tax=unclassified Actinopolyspora TaxID=2639451 RepID=UPI0013F5AE70|nr:MULTISPECIES: regulatory protein RecX [unclassified Actinopolyspora]NHD17377.1 regulatory protein RecX [Actinopolyspora sp. BKK2]NHE76890.1 regulatory protein RecX [Actinopolyspora sp. BKK1]